MPAHIAALPQFKGYPIPFTNHVYPDGTPDFRVLDPEKVKACMERKLCGICGQPLGPKWVFAGGPACRGSRLFSDPAMHEECGKFAYATCPYLLGRIDHSEEITPKRPDNVKEFAECPFSSNKRPDEMFLFYSCGYQIMNAAGHLYAQSTQFLRIRKMV
jgi:hypothetical protein